MNIYKYLRHPFVHYPPGTLWHLINHYFRIEPNLNLPLFSAENMLTKMDLLISERLVNIYHRMIGYETNHIPSERRLRYGMWNASHQRTCADVYKLLSKRDVHGFALYMLNAMRRPLTSGLGPGNQAFSIFVDSAGDGQRSSVLLLWDKLVTLAEAIGALPYERPEQSRYGKNIQIPFEELLPRIEAKLGIFPWHPPVMGNFGLAYKNNVIDVCVPDAAYLSFRLKTLGEHYKLSTIAALGGGIGAVALQSLRHGLGKFFLFDTPILNLVQGYFLMKTVGPDKVQMFGEPVAAAVVILPYWEFFNRSYSFGVVVNHDSLPDVSKQHAQEYVEEIQNRQCVFLSINQEWEETGGKDGASQLHVNHLMQNCQQMFCCSRHPYWIRKGYIEELYVPTSVRV